MGKYAAGTKIRLIRNAVSGKRDIGEVFTAASNTSWTDECQRLVGPVSPLQAYVDRDGRVTHCPEDYFELIHESPVRTATRQEIIPGTYDGVILDVDPEGVLHVRMVPMATRDPSRLDRAAAVLTALAGALRDGE